MKKNLILISVIILSFFTVFPATAQEKINQSTFLNQNAGQSPENAEQNVLKTDFDLFTGYRLDKLDWSIAGDSNGENPNILSELIWKNLQIYQIKANGNLIIDKRFRVEGYYGYGWINDGDNQDSDYLGNNRTFEFSRSNNTSDGDNVSDWSLGLGYQFNMGRVEYLACDELAFTVLGGYSHHEQNLKMTNGFQTIPATGAFDGLNSTYQAEWKGPWMGAELESPTGKLTTILRIEYHWADYLANADWNLRSDFAHPVSYTHMADGKGIIASFSVGYNINPNWLVFLKGDIQDWDTTDGIDRTFFSDGDVSDTRLNRVHWQSHAVMLGLKCRL